jgi:Tfp pilus assembly protein PilE
MNNKTRNGLIVVGIVAVLGYLAYGKFVKKSTTSDVSVGGQKSRDIIKNYLFSTYGYDKDREEFTKTMTQDYADAWANAIMNGQSTFLHNGNTIVTATGRVKK